MTKLADTRREYDFSRLTRKQLNTDPFKQSEIWLAQAAEKKLKDATCMTLATINEKHFADARIVLLKQLDEKGFCWYTNYASHKGQQLENNPNACLLFYWRDFDRQLKVQGKVEKLSNTEADEYFYSRPLESQFSAAASQQSQLIESREELENKLNQLKSTNPDSIKRPDSWGGYRLVPSHFEFWQGRENRLHDRFTYSLEQNHNWLITRLQP